jgi:cold shock CspA family protein
VATIAQPSGLAGPRITIIMFGTIQTYYEDRGYGFIKISFRERYFFHVQNFRGETVPTQGMRVEFDIAPGHKPGQPNQAIHVIPAEITDGAQ